jgi:hypothetical protein
MTDANTTLNVAEDLELDALLGGLDIGEDEIVTVQAVSDELPSDVIEEPDTEEAPLELAATEETVLDDETADAIEAEMDLQDTRGELYATQEADETDLEAQPEPAAPAKAPRAPKAAKPRVARISVDSLPVDAFVLTTDIPADLDANKAAVIRACPAQKKVQEKFENLLVSIHQGKAPSTYIMDCFRALEAKGGQITSLDLVAALKGTSLKNGSKTYSEGTARSQVGQIMALFPALKIATRAGNQLTLNPDSLLVEALRGFDAPAEVEEIPAEKPVQLAA